MRRSRSSTSAGISDDDTAIGSADATWSAPAGTAASATPVDPHPENKVGAAFAGGLFAAIVLKRLAKRRQG